MYRVIWQPRAESMLAELWLESADRNELTAAAHRADARLNRDPVGAGESRDGAERLLFEGPLGVYYRIDEASKTVFVLMVGSSNPR
jgi:hypothetical protein